MSGRTSRRRRGGFTVVELLIVVAIIAILVGLVAVAVFRVIGTRTQKNTETLLRKLDQALEQQWGEVAKAARKETPPPSVLALANGDRNRAQIIWIKLRLRQEFPMSYAEARAPWVVPTP